MLYNKYLCFVKHGLNEIHRYMFSAVFYMQFYKANTG